MSLKERVYSLLVVSAGEKLSEAIHALLPESACDPVCTAASISSAERMINDRDFDFVIVNSPLPDDAGIHFAMDVSWKGSVVLLLVKSDLYAGTHAQVVTRGVFTLAKPTSKTALSAALDWMAAARERSRRSEKKTLSLEEKMQEIRLINRAKWLLITECGMKEDDAHHYIEKQAMDNSLSKGKIAEKIIRTYS